MPNIIWRKWQDPLAPLAKVYSQDEDEADADFQKSRQSFGETETRKKNRTKKSGNAGGAIIGPMGIVPINESNIPSKLYNFWMGHTDFTITPKILRQIERVDGVETLDVFTRYRFRLGIGCAFDQDAVKRKIESKLCPPTLPAHADDPLGKFKRMLSKRYKFWAIMVLADGLDFIGGQDRKEVETKLATTTQKPTDVVYSWGVST